MPSKTQKVEVLSNVFVPDTHEVKYVGFPSKYDLYLGKDGVSRWPSDERSDGPLLILKKKPWRAEEGKSYCRVVIDGGDVYVQFTTDNRSRACNRDFQTGNYFETKAEALAVLGGIRAYFKRVRETGTVFTPGF